MVFGLKIEPKWLQENIEKLMRLNERRIWFQSTGVKLLFVNMSASSFFFMSTFLIWILGPNWFCQTTNQVQLCGFGDTCLTVGFVPSMIILNTASLSSRNVKHDLEVGRFLRLWWRDPHWMIPSSRLTCFFLLVLVSLCGFRLATSLFSGRFWKNAILQYPDPRDREREIPSMQRPTSKEITDSVELCETDSYTSNL